MVCLQLEISNFADIFSVIPEWPEFIIMVKISYKKNLRNGNYVKSRVLNVNLEGSSNTKINEKMERVDVLNHSICTCACVYLLIEAFSHFRNIQWASYYVLYIVGGAESHEAAYSIMEKTVEMKWVFDES